MVGALIMLGFNLLFWAQADVTQGVIVKKTPGAEESYWDIYEGGARYFSRSSLDNVVVEFNAADGRRFSFIPGWFDITDNYEVDDKVHVLYRPTEPQSAEIYRLRALIFGPILVFMMGIVFWVVGTLFRLVL